MFCSISLMYYNAIIYSYMTSDTISHMTSDTIARNIDVRVNIYNISFNVRNF